MRYDEQKDLSNARYEHAVDCLAAAKSLLMLKAIKVLLTVHTMQYFTL